MLSSQAITTQKRSASVFSSPITCHKSAKNDRELHAIASPPPRCNFSLLFCILDVAQD
ncbi:MAG: hypothetical protein LH631_09885 [Alkalinema sp. CAN_BIN05]|nr:hypothetical protein [Alkalinema sp. CAN_BIN05]